MTISNLRRHFCSAPPRAASQRRHHLHRYPAVPGNASDLSGLTPSGANTDRLSFGSDLVYDKASDTFYGMTDRGPDAARGARKLQPRVEAFKVTFGAGNAPVAFALQKTVLFTNTAGQVANGLNPTLLNGNVSTLGNSFKGWC